MLVYHVVRRLHNGEGGKVAKAAIIDKKLLDALGITLNRRDFERLSQYMHAEYSRRVVDELAEELSVEQAKQFKVMLGASNDQLLEWLRANVTDFAEIASDERDILLGDLAENPEGFIRRALMANG
jgi:hypothetical protein